MISTRYAAPDIIYEFNVASLLDDLHRHHGFRPEVVRVEVEESVGQSATCELRLG